MVTEDLLDEYEQQIVENPDQLKNYVTNRLLEHSADPDPRVRIRALELLGKSVGMFTDKTEVVVKELSTEELEVSLKEKLDKVLKHSPHLLDASSE